MSHSSHTTRVLEQRNLLGGADLVTQITRGKRTQQRTLHVDGRWKVGFAAALALVVGHGKETNEAVPSMTRCPRCGLMGRTDEDFGTRVIRGQRRPQSWCRSCRSAHVVSSNSTSSTRPVQFEWGFASASR